MTYWQVPELWPGSTVVLLGGGPSMTRDQVDYCRGRAHVIAINNAYRVAPWADMLYFCEEKFWLWNRARPEFKEFRGVKVALETANCFAFEPLVHRLKNYKWAPGLELDAAGNQVADGLRHGWSSGYAAIGLAMLLGARRIVLLGYDMKAAADGSCHWHKDYPLVDGPGVYAEKMLGMFPSLIEPLRDRGVTVINATSDTALRCFPRFDLHAALGVRAGVEDLAIGVAAR